MGKRACDIAPDQFFMKPARCNCGPAAQIGVEVNDIHTVLEALSCLRASSYREKSLIPSRLDLCRGYSVSRAVCQMLLTAQPECPRRKQLGSKDLLVVWAIRGAVALKQSYIPRSSYQVIIAQRQV